MKLKNGSKVLKKFMKEPWEVEISAQEAREERQTRDLERKLELERRKRNKFAKLGVE